jgi:hypothetical protein
MNVYMPPQRREDVEERREIRNHVRDFLSGRGIDVISRTDEARDLPWTARADALVLETNHVTEADERECLYMAQDLGRQVLVLFDKTTDPSGYPSDDLVAASRRSGNENSNLWIVKHHPLGAATYAIVDSALDVFIRADLGIRSSSTDEFSADQ